MAKPFTVWIADQLASFERDGQSIAGYIDRPFVCHVDAENGADILQQALSVYKCSFGYPADGWQEFAAENGAYVFQVIAGHIPFNLIDINYDGYHADELENAFNMGTK